MDDHDEDAERLADASRMARYVTKESVPLGLQIVGLVSAVLITAILVEHAGSIDRAFWLFLTSLPTCAIGIFLNTTGSRRIDWYASRAYTVCVSAEFDPKKDAANIRKHGVSLAEGDGVLNDPLALTVEDDSTEGERRFVTIGMNVFGSLIVVVHTPRGDGTRTISVRRPGPKERRNYEKGV